MMNGCQRSEEKERQKVRKALETYCALDTEGMIMIVQGLAKLSR